MGRRRHRHRWARVPTPPAASAPALGSGPMVGRPAAPSASLTSALRLASGEATASLAAVWMVGLSSSSQMSTSAISSTISASSALKNQDGSIDSWSSVPSMVIGTPPSGLTNSWNGRVLGWPRQNRLTGLTRTLAKPAMPGSTRTPGGLMSNFRLRSASVPSTSALRRALPRLSIARSWVPVREPREVRGASSANGSRNDPTLIVPSSTADPAGSSRERARMPYGTTPAGVEAARGGRKTSLAVASAPGKREMTAGSAAAQAAESPMTSSVNSSTTLPVFRTRTSAVASCPGSTARAGVTSVTDAPTSVSVAACSLPEQGPTHGQIVLSGVLWGHFRVPVKCTLTGRTPPRGRVRRGLPAAARSRAAVGGDRWGVHEWSPN